MSGINWKLFLTVAILAVGLYLIVVYQDSSDLQEMEKARYRTLRNVGWVTLVAGIGLGVYFYYTGAIKFKAEMPNDCAECKMYIKRHQNLRPYSTSEYQELKKHATACNMCSNMCFDEIEILQKYPPTNRDQIPKYKKELASKKVACAETTKHAILARQELGRLESKMRGQQAKYWQTVGGETAWSPFPKVPT